MAGRSKRGDDRRVADLEDTVKQRDLRIEELRQRDEAAQSPAAPLSNPPA